ncbi:MAG: 5-formyltetrahydrofolate cyclo-ligase, partial [Actinomycetota bacterium]|nr:5-formyltetrahydrofolate cyclo-ligase [Actinomycetota bacterium]
MAAKRALREEVWDALTDAGAERFPGAQGRIPNFAGAEAAAERLRRTDDWRAATALKSNPDAPQWPVRQRALEDGIVVYMAVPRLAEA